MRWVVGWVLSSFLLRPCLFSLFVSIQQWNGKSCYRILVEVIACKLDPTNLMFSDCFSYNQLSHNLGSMGSSLKMLSSLRTEEFWYYLLFIYIFKFPCYVMWCYQIYVNMWIIFKTIKGPITLPRLCCLNFLKWFEFIISHGT